MNRIQLMIDVLDFHKLGILRLDPFLSAIDGLTYENEYAVIFHGLRNIQWLKDKLANSKYHLNFRVRVKQFLSITKLYGSKLFPMNNQVVYLFMDRKIFWKS